MEASRQCAAGPRLLSGARRRQHSGVRGVHNGSRFMRAGVSVTVGGGGTASVVSTGAGVGCTAPPVGVEQEAASIHSVPMTSTISAIAAICCERWPRGFDFSEPRPGIRADSAVSCSRTATRGRRSSTAVGVGRRSGSGWRVGVDHDAGRLGTGACTGRGRSGRSGAGSIHDDQLSVNDDGAVPERAAGSKSSSAECSSSSVSSAAAGSAGTRRIDAAAPVANGCASSAYGSASPSLAGLAASLPSKRGDSSRSCSDTSESGSASGRYEAERCSSRAYRSERAAVSDDAGAGTGSGARNSGANGSTSAADARAGVACAGCGSDAGS